MIVPIIIYDNLINIYNNYLEDNDHFIIKLCVANDINIYDIKEKFGK